jgi:glycerol-3-phosphate O-acyltransferase
MAIAMDAGSTAGPAGRTEPVILLVEATTEVERELIGRWAESSGPAGARVLPLDGSVLTGPLAGGRRRRGGDGGARGVAAARAQRRAARPLGRRPRRAQPPPPAPRDQARISRREPDRAEVVVAAPATVAELRERAGDEDLGPFVARQALLALERAERALVGDRYKVPTQIVEMIQADPQFRREVADLADRLELPQAEVLQKAVADLHGLVAAMSPMAVDLLTGVLRPLHARAWDVQVDAAGLERLRELGREHPLVFLPSHRSYADPLLLADVLAEHDFPRNHVLGGENLRFWPVGPVAKRAGVVFIRRSFGDDEVYKLAVREYFGFLLSKRFNLEWYMEGGRSRTGKLRPPRYGLLANVAEAIEQGRADDVLLVPVSITYDQLREVAAMAAEQAAR